MKPDNDELDKLLKDMRDNDSSSDWQEFCDEFDQAIQSHHNKLLSDLVGELPSAGGRLADESAGYNDCLEDVTALPMRKITK